MDTIGLRADSTRVAADAFKGFMSSFYTGVSIVTSIDAAGRRHGLTCNSLVSVTVEPPTLLVCLDRRCGTLAALRESRTFAVNLLAERGRAAAEVFATAAADRFESVAWRGSPRSGLPVLHEDAFGVAECAVVDLHEIGDHVAVFGRVTELEHRPDRPLLYGLRAFCGPPVPVVPTQGTDR